MSHSAIIWHFKGQAKWVSFWSTNLEGFHIASQFVRTYSCTLCAKLFLQSSCHSCHWHKYTSKNLYMFYLPVQIYHEIITKKSHEEANSLSHS